jgi:hypothetical protein
MNGIAIRHCQLIVVPIANGIDVLDAELPRSVRPEPEPGCMICPVPARILPARCSSVCA